jgi:putative flippase GtrA
LIVLPRLWDCYGLKVFRYCGVSVFNVIFGQSLLLFFYSVLDWPAWLANVTAVCISAGPAYWFSRHWVWGQRGAHSVRGEIAPFWSMALLGLGVSTLAVDRASARWPHNNGAVLLASISAFGVVWVFKFLILEKVMWNKLPADPVEPVETLEVPT